MARWLKEFYGDTLGPLGFPMKDQDALSLDKLLEELPSIEYDHVTLKGAVTETLEEGERADISWISTESVDGYKNVILSSGMDASRFKLNPIVTLDHNYWQPPVGTSSWQRRFIEGDKRGIKAKTVYPEKPTDWLSDKQWPSDAAFALVKSGLMKGKSIGFLALEAHEPTEAEIQKRPDLVNVRRIVTKWLLLEYACTWLPANKDSITEVVSRGLVKPETFHALSLALPDPTPPPAGGPAAPEAQKVIPFTTFDEVVRYAQKCLGESSRVIRMSLDDAVARITGKV